MIDQKSEPYRIRLWNMSAISEYLESVLTPDQCLMVQWLERTENRVMAEKLIRVLYAMDEVMTHSRQPDRDWQQIALALGLPSCRYLQLTEKRIGRQFGIGPMAVSKSITKLLRLAELKPNGRGYNGTNGIRTDL